MGPWKGKKPRSRFRLKSGSVRSGWCSIIRASTDRNGRRSVRLRRRSAVRRNRCGAGYANQMAVAGRRPGGRAGAGARRPWAGGPRAASGSRRWSVRTASCARQTKFCARRQLVLPRRSSTAGPSHDRVPRRSPPGPRGRADLQGSADRSVDYHAQRAVRRNPGRASARIRRDAVLSERIRRVFDDNFQVYGARKVWRQLKREGEDVARCTVERLMREMGLQGAVRGRPIKATKSDPATPCPVDRVNRQFQAPRPNALWVSDFTSVPTWTGFVYVAFVIDAFARRIVGWRVSRTAHAGFGLDALKQALHDRQPVRGGGLVHHSDRGVQYVSIRYTARLIEAGVEPPVGSVGDSYDNALA